MRASSDKCTYIASEVSVCLLTQATVWITTSREFYFSVNNLCRDVFLRMRMNREGWVPLHVVCSFNKMKQLTADKKLVLDSIKSLSTKLEVDEDKQRMRLKDDWAMWVFPKVDLPTCPPRFESATLTTFLLSPG